MQNYFNWELRNFNEYVSNVSDNIFKTYFAIYIENVNVNKHITPNTSIENCVTLLEMSNVSDNIFKTYFAIYIKNNNINKHITPKWYANTRTQTRSQTHVRAHTHTRID